MRGKILADFDVFAAWSSSRAGFLSDNRVFDTSPRAATITDGDGTLSLNETTAFTYVGIPDGPDDDVGPYDMYSFSITGGGQAIWMAGNGQSGGILVPLDQAAYDTFTSGVSYTIASGSSITSTLYSSFYVAASGNIAPSLGGMPMDDTALEDQTTAIDLSAYNVSDDDGDTITLTITVDRGTIASTDGNGTTAGVTLAGSGSTSMTLQGTAANLNTYLNVTTKITFTAALNDTTAATLTVTPFDGTVNGSSDTVTISITSVNDEPTLTATGSNPTFTEGGTAGSLFTGTNISTVEAGQTIEALTLTVTNVTNGSSEIVNLDGMAIALTNGTSGTTATNSLSYSVSVVGTTATLSLAGGAMSTAAAQTLIDSASYQNTSSSPDTSDRVITLTALKDSGGTANGGDDTAALSVASTVTVAGVNDGTTGDLIISGEALEGETLTVDGSDLRDRDGMGALSYQWLKDGSRIEGATGNSYLLTEDDVGGRISVIAEYRDGSGFAERVKSAPSAPITPLGESIGGTLDSDDLLGTDGDDEISGKQGNDNITGGQGDDRIIGGPGTDTAHYSGEQSSYTLQIGPGTTTITDRRPGGDGTDELIDMEFLDFSSGTFDPFDLIKFGGAAELSPEDFESVIELYIAYFNRAPDAIGLNFWGTAFANGTTLEEMATLFIEQPETLATYPPGTSNGDFVDAVFSNVLGRSPDEAGFNFWLGILQDDLVSRDQFILEVLRGVQSGSPDQAYLDLKVDIGAYFGVHKGMSDVDNASAAMALFDGTQASTDAAVAAIDAYHADALAPDTGEFMISLVGVLEETFGLM